MTTISQYNNHHKETSTMTNLTARNANLMDLAALLTDQHSRKVDVVAPASSIRAEGGQIIVDGTEAEITMDGVTPTAGIYSPTAIFDESVAGKLGIPTQYLRRTRNENVDLYDANINGWLAQDDRAFMMRMFRGENGVGVARAMLSDKYRIVDNFDVLTAALQALKDSDLEVDIDGCDLSERRMSVRIVAPQITVLAEELLKNYRSPFSGQSGKDLPIIQAGLVISNSETGGGAFSIVPRARVLVCKNGLTMTKDAMRSVHLGGKLDEGVIKWSDDTIQKNLELVGLKTVDAVKTFLDADYLQTLVDRTTEQAGQPLAKPVEAVQFVAKKLSYTDDFTNTLLDHFIKGGDTTAGGVLHAVTSAAQTVVDPDLAQQVEESAFRAMELAAAH